MRILLTHTAVGLLIAGAAVAQQQPAQDQQQPGTEQVAGQPAEGFLQVEESDILATRVHGIAVFAPAEAGAPAPQAADGHAIDSADLADYVNVGHVADVVLTSSGEPRGIVISLTVGQQGSADMDATPAPDADPDARAPDAAPGTAPGAGTAVGTAPSASPRTVGMGPEVALEINQFGIFSDINAPGVMFAVVGIPAEELQAGPPVERHLAMGGTGPVGMVADEPALQDQGWMMGRAPMAAPGVAVDGFQPVPIAEVPLDDLIGATVFGRNTEQIGSVGDVVLGAGGEAQYILVDVGGFLGIGTRQVAIGFDEMTVLRDAGWAEMQVHVDAAREEVENLPEYES